jgi:hypothetical protein
MEKKDIPEQVLQKAKYQSKHLEEMLIAAQKREEERDRKLAACPPHRRQKLEERYESERNEEALRITRMRSDHIALLNYEANQESAIVRHPHRKKGAFLLPDQPKRDAPGSTLKDLEFMKEMARKLDIQDKVKPSEQKSYHQALAANRLASVKVLRSEVV